MNTPHQGTTGAAAATWQFALVPEPPATFSRTEHNELERLKNRLLVQALAGLATPALTAPIRRAANEAAAVAWLEPHPLLVFAALFEEKVAAAKRRAHKQVIIRARSAGMIAAVA